MTEYQKTQINKIWAKSGCFWDKRWEEMKVLDPSLKDEDRPVWMKPSITPAAFKKIQEQKALDDWMNIHFAT